MTDQLLSSLYVDIELRHLDAAMQGVRRIAGQAEETGKAFRRMKEEIVDAGSATRQVSQTIDSPISRWGRGTMTSPAPVNRPRSWGDSGVLAPMDVPRPAYQQRGMGYTNTPTAYQRPQAPVDTVTERPRGPIATGPSLPGGFNPAASRPQAAAPVMTTGGALRAAGGAGQAGAGGMGAGAVAGLASSLGLVAAAAGAAAAAIGTVVSITKQGLQGTVEIEQFGNAVLQVGRELAGIVAPAIRLATSLLNQLTAAFRGTGAEGQMLLSMFTGVGVFFEVLADPSVVASVKQLGAAFAELVTAAQPLIVVAANVASDLLKAFVVEPLVLFVTALTEAVKLMTEFAKQAVEGQRAILGLIGMQDLLKARGKNRREVSLNQTGTEDAQGTFQRIQQAVLKMGMPVEQAQETPDVALLKEIKEAVVFIKGVCEWVRNKAGDVDPKKLAQGGTGIGLGLLGLPGLDRLLGR